MPVLIIAPGLTVSWWSLPRELREDSFMTDLIFVGVVIALFLIGGLYAIFCEKL